MQSTKSGFDRILYVCTNDAGDYSPGVYVHGAAGGGPAGLAMLKKAARYMRAAEVGDAAAGLCGYFFSQMQSAAGLSIVDSPQSGVGGKVDWQAYAGWNVDLVLINLDHGAAECYSSNNPPDKGPKVVTGRIDGLIFLGE